MDANSLVAPLHDRMPVILNEKDFKVWIDPNAHDKDVLKPLLKPFPAEELDAYKVTPRMNSFKYNNAGNVQPVKPQETSS